MKVGFSGTRYGMTSAQRESLRVLLLKLNPTQFAHGDCVGADDEAAKLIFSCPAELGNCEIVCHPPVDAEHRAFNDCHDEIREPKTHFARNRAIVDESDVLVATPRESAMGPRGGTAYTVGYAQKKGKPVYVIWPNGNVASIGTPAEATA